MFAKRCVVSCFSISVLPDLRSEGFPAFWRIIVFIEFFAFCDQCVECAEIRWFAECLDLIRLVNEVIGEYKAQGYELTLRQTYYQLVARGYIPNNERSYKNIGSLINDGRLAGLIDWCAIIDRTRNLRRNSHWEKPSDVIYSAKYSYLLDKWKGNPSPSHHRHHHIITTIYSLPSHSLPYSYYLFHSGTSARRTQQWSHGYD